ncbi:MAG: phage tail protein [Lachnospiraceae bacterium]|nr:phage tail protein [Lachnospiraceae bacterium]
MSENKNVVITKLARMKLVKARAGAEALPHIVGMAFGNGGVNADGSVINPSDSQTELANELYRKQIDRYSFPTDTICRYECTLTEAELAGEEISEIGLYDEEGDIVCIKNFMRKGKDEDIKQIYVLDDIF